ncbi:Cellulose synthase operon protein C [plant metagenome]|uniref:Cellulose synthase operon protein C n=1 Tax=plant metagenome TaxID=1297885 RepID=A0A484SFL1_9ZZZZ
MSKSRHTLAAGLLLALVQHAGWAQDEPTRLLSQQGQYWQERGDNDRAGQAWGKLLNIEPANQEALYGLAFIEIREKRLGEAQKYLDKLRGISPNGRYTRQLQQDLQLARPANAKELETARLLAESSELDKAMPHYRKAFEGLEPMGDVGLEYYGRLGYTDGGWDTARRGLERLQQDRPGNPTIQLVLAKLLILNQGAWRDGIQRLSKLAQRADVGGEATESWRLGLLWRGVPGPAERELYTAYLKVHPTDDEVRKLYNGIGQAMAAQRGPVRDPILTRGFAALDKEDLQTAEAAFREKLAKTPDDADALGGLGLVRMQQENLPEAHDLLTRAARRNAKSWTPSLNIARYWILVNEAGKAQAAGDVAAARDLSQRAIKLNASQAGAYNTLAAIDAEEGKLPEAEKRYRQVLAKHRNNPQALEGLVSVLARQGRLAEAQQSLDQLMAGKPDPKLDLGKLRAAIASGQAKAALDAGNPDAARAALESALRDDPQNPWIRYELARVYLDLGLSEEARGIRDGLLISHPDTPSALYASAMLAGEMGDWEQADQTMQRIPPQSRTAYMDAFGRDVWVNAQAANATRLAEAGRSADARALLGQLEGEAAGKPALLGAIASAYVDAGDPARGMALMRPHVSRDKRPQPDVLLPYAGLLLKTKQDVEFASVMRDLHGRKLTVGEQRSYNNLQFLYTVRQADVLRERGDLVAAYDTLAPALATRPQDPMALSALARMYSDGGDNKKALEIYQHLVAKDPDNAQWHLGAAMAATQLGQNRYADSALDNAVALAPDNAEVLLTAARMYRQRGRSGKAAELLQSALAAQERSRQPTQVAAASDSAARAVNPFIGLPGQRQSGLQPEALAETRSAASPFVPAQARAVEPPAIAHGSQAPFPPLSQHAQAQASSNQRLTPYAAAPVPVPAPAVAQSSAVPVHGTPQPAPSRSSPGSAAPAAVATIPALTAATATRAQPVQPTREPAPVYNPYDSPAPVQQAAPAPVPAVPAYGQQPTQTAYAQPPMAGPMAEDARLAEIRSELDDVMQDRSAEARVGVNVRSNNGQDGTSKLTSVETPVEFRFPVGDGKVVLNATHVSLNAGRLGDDYAARSQFGAGPQAALNDANGVPTGSVGRQRDSGVGLSAAYEMRGIRADIGTTPLGFERTNIVGGVALNGLFPGSQTYWYGVDVSRRAMTDSVLSFAGTRDDRSGLRWGGVTSTGVQLQAGADYQTHGVYGSASWHSLNGQNTKSNNRTEVAGGIYRHLIREEDRLLTAGLHASATFYGNNQRFFTYGHGGYFSPQSMYYLGVPVTWAQRNDRLTYKLQGSVGVQRFKEDDADYFPTDASMQQQADLAMAQARAQGLEFNNGPRYSGQSSTGFGYNLAAAAEYQMAPNWFIGANAGMDNAKDYRQWQGGLYLRYTLYPMSRQMALPVVPFQSPYQK